MEWQPIETAPKQGKFIVLRDHDEVMTVERYNAPFKDVKNAVIDRFTGKWWVPKYWIPLPTTK